MAKGNEIIVSATPRGVFQEGIVSGTPKPGTLMQLQAGTAAVNGRFTYEAYAPGTDGNRRPICVLLPDHYQGRLATTAYANGERCFLYFPLPGEELNMLVQDVSGTGDDWDIGDLLIADTGTGKLIATTGSPEAEPFTSLEVVTDPTADHLLHVMFNGY